MLFALSKFTTTAQLRLPIDPLPTLLLKVMASSQGSLDADMADPIHISTSDYEEENELSQFTSFTSTRQFFKFEQGRSVHGGSFYLFRGLIMDEAIPGASA